MTPIPDFNDLTPPSLQEQALALLPYDPQEGTVTLNSVEVLKIRRALVEQVGEGKA